MKKNKLLVFLDVDGVLLDNYYFEEAVTNFIIEYIARSKSISSVEALELWRRSLIKEKLSSKWYDYDQHCSNIGIDPITIKAHESAKRKLRLVPGARQTWNFLRELVANIYITSNACRWVVEFKLDNLGLGGYVDIFSSQHISITKNDPNFWLQVKPIITKGNTKIVMDNVIENILGATQVTDNLTCIFLDRPEHSVSLPKEIRPLSNYKKARGTGIHIVYNHVQLRKIVAELMRD